MEITAEIIAGIKYKQHLKCNLMGKLASNSTAGEAAEFFRVNKLNARQAALVKNLFAEARENNFSVILEKG